jgi:hypothetical protein
MSAHDWLTWGAEDAKKPVKPYAGLPTVEHPELLRRAKAEKKHIDHVLAEEHEKYGKDVSRIAIGTANWADKVWEALREAQSFAEFKQLLQVS